jgi:hypothetical protein
MADFFDDTQGSQSNAAASNEGSQAASGSQHGGSPNQQFSPTFGDGAQQPEQQVFHQPAQPPQHQQQPAHEPAQADPSKSAKILTAEESMAEAEKAVLQRGKAKFEEEQKAIGARVKETDDKNSAGVSSMKKAALGHQTDEQKRRESHIQTARKAHRDEQKATEERTAKLQRGGHLWEQVGEVIDTSKTNKFSAKSTDRMRNLLTNLKTKPNAKQISAAE